MELKEKIRKLLIDGYSIPRISTITLERQEKIKKIIKSNYGLLQIYNNNRQKKKLIV